MGNYLSPGLYVRETDFSFYVKQISTSAAGFTGVAERGPINRVQLVTSWEQFVRKYGSYVTAGYLAYAARAFFDNGGNILYVNRVAHYTDITDKTTLTAVKSTKMLKDRKTESPPDTLRVDAINEGTWGDRLSVVIGDGTLDPDNEFDLAIKLDGQVVEIFRNLSMDEAAPNFVELKVNEKSEYVTVLSQASTTPAPGNRPALGEAALDGGDDGLTGMADADYIGDAANHTGVYAFDEIDAVNLLALPGVTSAAVIHAGIAYCEGRQDCMLIAECPISLDPLVAVDFRKGQGDYTHAAFNSSYAAIYYPWLEISDPVTSQRKLVPPSGAVCGCFARSDEKTQVWYAPAGIDRGRVFNALGLAYKTSRGERDVLYPEGINVIASFPDSGINIWGQKTLQSQPSALDRVNVRRLMMYMEEAISESSRFVVFEPHNPQTWRALIRLINPFLQGIKEKGGLYDFAVQCDEETNTSAHIDRNELVCRVFVKPTKTAEFVELNFILVATGGTFAEIFNPV